MALFSFNLSNQSQLKYSKFKNNFNKTELLH